MMPFSTGQRAVIRRVRRQVPGLQAFHITTDNENGLTAHAGCRRGDGHVIVEFVFSRVDGCETLKTKSGEQFFIVIDRTPKQ